MTVSQSCYKLFYAEIKTFGDLPNFENAEIKLVDDILKENLTYPAIQPVLIQKVKLYLGDSGLKGNEIMNIPDKER